MPLIFQQQVNEVTKIGVWHITEDEDFFSAAVPVAREITHPHKRLQHLAARYILRHLFPDFPLSLVQISAANKPFLADEAFHFSVSHCGNYAAAVVSTEDRVGADIEIPRAKIEAVAHKFLSPREMMLLDAAHGSRAALLTLAWSAKEAVFKWYGEGQVDFIRDIPIMKIEQTPNGFTVSCAFKKRKSVLLQVRCILLDGIVLSCLASC